MYTVRGQAKARTHPFRHFLLPLQDTGHGARGDLRVQQLVQRGQQRRLGVGLQEEDDLWGGKEDGASTVMPAKRRAV